MCWNTAASWNSAAIPSCLPTRDSTTPCGHSRLGKAAAISQTRWECAGSRTLPHGRGSDWCIAAPIRAATVRERYHSLMRVLSILLLCVAALAQPKTGEWQSLFDGKTLQGWRETAFTGHGKARVENGTVVLAAGEPMTGITWSGAFPKMNYE